MNTPQQDIQTLPAAQEQEMRAMQNLFQRAANVIVDASKLGEEVRELREQLKTLLADTERMREHISWLEQENATLRTQRDEAQNSLSDAKRELDAAIFDYRKADERASLNAAERDNARGEAKLWQEEAGTLEKERNGLKTEVVYLKGLLDNVWQGIKDHFQEAQAPKTGFEPTPVTQSTDPNAPHYVHQPRDEFGRWVDPNQSAPNSGDSGHQHF